MRAGFAFILFLREQTGIRDSNFVIRTSFGIRHSSFVILLVPLHRCPAVAAPQPARRSTKRL